MKRNKAEKFVDRLIKEHGTYAKGDRLYAKVYFGVVDKFPKMPPEYREALYKAAKQLRS